MSFAEKLKNNKFIITAEIAAIKGTDISLILDGAKSLKDKVDAVNITDNQTSIMKIAPLPLAHLLLEIGLEPILQMTCRDRNRLALQSDLLGAHLLGIRNILALTGDHPTFGDHRSAKSVFDIDSVQMLNIIAKLNNGRDSEGNPLKGATDFFAGAAINPNKDPLEPELLKMKKKIDQGTQFFQTQVVYDIDRFKHFMEKTESLQAKIILGIMPLESVKIALFMRDKVPGVIIPDKLIKELQDSKDPLQTGLKQAIKIILELKDCCRGVHLMTRGKEELVLQLIDLLNIS